MGHRGEPVRPKSFRLQNAPRSLFSEVGHRGAAMFWGGSLPTCRAMRSGTPRNFVRPASGHAPPVRALCGLIRSRREAGEPGLPRNSHGGKFLSGASGASGRTCAPQEFPPAQCAPFAFFRSGASGRGHALGQELPLLPGHAPRYAPELHVPRFPAMPRLFAACAASCGAAGIKKARQGKIPSRACTPENDTQEDYSASSSAVSPS